VIFFLGIIERMKYLCIFTLLLSGLSGFSFIAYASPSEKEKISEPVKIVQGKAKNKLITSDYYKKGREAYLLFTIKGYRKAIKLFDKALKIDKKDVLALAGKSEAQSLLSQELSQGQYGLEGTKLEMQAFENAYIAVDLQSDLCQAHRALSMAYYNQGRYQEGKKEARTAIDLNDKDAESHLLFWLNNPDKKKLKSDSTNDSNFYNALNPNSESIKKAIKLNPDIVLFYLDLGAVYASQKKYDEAIDNYKKVIELNPENERAFSSLGFIYNDLSKLDEAIKQFDKALKIDPDHVVAIYGKGIIYLKKRDRITAVEYFNKACNSGYEDSCDLKSNPDLQLWRRNMWSKRRNRSGQSSNN